MLAKTLPTVKKKVAIKFLIYVGNNSPANTEEQLTMLSAPTLAIVKTTNKAIVLLMKIDKHKQMREIARIIDKKPFLPSHFTSINCNRIA